MAERGSPASQIGPTRRDSANVPNLSALLTESRNERPDPSNAQSASSDAPAAHLTSPLSGDTPSESTPTVVASSNLDTIIDLFSTTQLSDEDLRDLATEAYPETERSATESKTGYPASGQYSSLVVSSFPESLLQAPNIAADADFPSTAHIPDRSDSAATTSCQPFPRYCVDLRRKSPGLHTFCILNIPRHPGQEVREAVAALLHCGEGEEVVEVQRSLPRPVQLLVVGPAPDHLHLIITAGETIACLSVPRDMTLTSGLALCREWFDRPFGQLPPEVCLLHREERLERENVFGRLDNFCEVELVRCEPLTVRFLYRPSQHCEKILYVDCNDTDYVWEAKRKFLQLYWREDGADCSAESADQVWLTAGERVVPDNVLLRKVWMVKGDSLAYATDSDPGSYALTSSTFHVHFQPADAVAVKLKFKSDARKFGKSESTILVSAAATVAQLRQEVAKVIHKDPQSFKMFISGKKMEMTTVLKPFLTTANSTVVVEQRGKINVTVTTASHAHTATADTGSSDTCHRDTADTSTSDTATSYSGTMLVAVHKYDRVRTLKQQVMDRLTLPAYCVDLHHSQRPLDEEADLRGSRIRNGDAIQAIVWPHRVRVCVRLRSGQWQDVVIDDVTISTVKQLKLYARSVLTGQASDQGGQPRGLTVYQVLFNGVLLRDNVTLREAGVGMNARLLMVEEESLCYTAAHWGRLPVYFCHSKDDYRPPHRHMAMSDGQFLYFRNAPTESTEAPQILQTEVALPQGIRPGHPHLLGQFPPRLPHPPLSPAGGEASCRHRPSPSPSSFSSSPPKAGADGSRSSLSRRETCGGRDFRTPKTSTPIKSGEGSQGLDFADSPFLGGEGGVIQGGVTLSSQASPPEQSAPLADPSAMSDGDDRCPPVYPGLYAKILNRSCDHTSTRSCNESDYEAMQRSTSQLSQSSSGSREARGPASAVHLSTSHIPTASRKSRQDQPAPSLQLSRDPNLQSHGGDTVSGGQVVKWPYTAIPYESERRNPFFRDTDSGRTRHHSECFSDCEGVRTLARKSCRIEERVEQDSQGHLKSVVHFEGSKEIGPTLQEAWPCLKALASGNFRLPPQPLPALTGAGSPTVQPPDTTFLYVKKEIIMAVAEHLGREGDMVLLQLLPDNIFREIDQRSYSSICMKYYDGLTQWCQREGRRASVEKLKQVLLKNNRLDLADEVDRLATKEQGYETAP